MHLKKSFCYFYFSGNNSLKTAFSWFAILERLLKFAFSPVNSKISNDINCRKMEKWWRNKSQINGLTDNARGNFAAHC